MMKRQRERKLSEQKCRDVKKKLINKTSSRHKEEREALIALIMAQLGKTSNTANLAR